MHKVKIEALLPFDPKIEKTCKKNKKERMQTMVQNLDNNGGQVLQNQPEANANNKVLTDFVVPQLDSFNSSIVRLDILAHNFELKPILFQMLQSVGQFIRLLSEDPTMHLLNFFGICESQK